MSPFPPCESGHRLHQVAYVGVGYEENNYSLMVGVIYAAKFVEDKIFMNC